MTNSQEERAKDSRDTQTISIEIPKGIFEAMYRMMSGRGDSEAAASGCCDMSRGTCCPQSEQEDSQDFVFTIRRKE